MGKQQDVIVCLLSFFIVDPVLKINFSKWIWIDVQPGHIPGLAAIINGFIRFVRLVSELDVGALDYLVIQLIEGYSGIIICTASTLFDVIPSGVEFKQIAHALITHGSEEAVCALVCCACRAGL